MEVKSWYAKEERKSAAFVHFVLTKSNMLTIKSLVSYGSMLPNGEKSFPAVSPGIAPITNAN
jgi:hypothetical protein